MTAKAGWTAALIVTSLLMGNPLTLALLLPVLLAFWLLPQATTHLAGVTLTLAHLLLALVVVTADAPDENRAFAPITMVVVDLALLAGCALLAPALERRP